MNRVVTFSLGALLLQSFVPAAPQQGGLSVNGLKCEYLQNPLGIDVEKPRLSWMLGPGEPGLRQSAYRILVASTPESLQGDKGDLWDSDVVKSSQSTFVTYDGRALTTGMRCYWKVRVWDQQNRSSAWSGAATWSMGVLKPSDWYGKWIGMARPAEVKEGTPLPFPWLRKNVTLKSKPRRATAYVNPLGYFELYINGKKVDDRVLSPAVSDYSKRNLYVALDVTDYLAAGKNCVALWLGRGWYVRGHPGVIHDGPLVRAQLDMTFADGSTGKLGTDETWKVKESPLTPLGAGRVFFDYGGERYDSRLELSGWNSVTLDDSAWQPAALFDPPQVTTAAEMVEPNRIVTTIKPKKVTEMSPGVYLMEMERTYTGWFEFRIPAGLKPGSMVKLEFADFPPAGNRFNTNNQRDEILVNGSKAQTFRSRFNYHAFGWVRITGLTKPPSLDDAKGMLIHTGYEQAADFESSDDLMDRIYKMVAWTYRCLTMGGYVVDCPHRERLGYGGDAGTSIETGMFNFASGGLYNRWTANWRDAQDANTGDVPYTAPNYQDRGGGGPMWSGFTVTLPWHLYLQYGDKRTLEQNYPMMRRWLDFAETKTVDHVLEYYKSFGMTMGEWNYLGDWVAPRRPGQPEMGRDTQSARLINNLHYLYTLQIMSRIAAILDKGDDAARYKAQADTLQRVLHERFYDPAKGIYAGGQQPYLAFPLLVGVVPRELRNTVNRRLEQTILVDDQGHINAGMHGTYFLLKYLMEADRNDLIYAMASKTDFPSWGHMLAQGATTVWEGWDGGSHIHDTLISIGSWFIQGIGGIRIDEQSPGFKHFVVRPAIVGDLKFARTKYISPYGQIVSNWRVENGVFHLDVTVPPGTTATLQMPQTASADVTEGSRPAAQTPGVRVAGVKAGRASFDLEPGQYAFAAKLVK